MTHFFISVGTSQLDQERLGLNSELAAEMERIKKGPIQNAAVVSNRLAKAINPKLAEYWQELADQPQIAFSNNRSGVKKTTNRFGAEITTLLFCLWAGSKQNIMDRAASAEPDRYYLLLSDTDAGQLTGNILQKFFFEVWCADTDNVWMKTAKGLNSNPRTPADARKAVNTFAELVATALDDSFARTTGRIERSFIMSGGYKSTIPVMDWFSLAYHIPLNYLFEEADVPMSRLTLPLSRDVRDQIKEKIQEIFQVNQMPPVNQY